MRIEFALYPRSPCENDSNSKFEYRNVTHPVLQLTGVDIASLYITLDGTYLISVDDLSCTHANAKPYKNLSKFHASEPNH